MFLVLDKAVAPQTTLCREHQAGTFCRERGFEDDLAAAKPANRVTFCLGKG